MHHPDFQKLEGHVARAAPPGHELRDQHHLKIKVLNVSKRELFKDVDKAVEFDQSQIFKKLYENEFGIARRRAVRRPDRRLRVHQPSRGHRPAEQDVERGGGGLLPVHLRRLAEAVRLRQLVRSCPSRATWRRSSTRSSTPSGSRSAIRDDSRFVTLTMPRVLARLPYGAEHQADRGVRLRGGRVRREGSAKPVPHDQYSWMNAAYVMGARLTDAFAKYGWCTAIRGAEGGGKVEGLPAHIFTSDDGDTDLKCPTEIGITDRRENELEQARLPAAVPLQEHRLRRVLRRPDDAEAEEVRPARGHGQRRHLGAAAVHHGHVAVRPLPQGDGPRQDRLVHGGGGLRGLAERWIKNYVNADPKAEPGGEGQVSRLREAKVEVKEIPGKPGSYNAIAWLRPWLQFEELTTSLRMVARIPQLNK